MPLRVAAGSQTEPADDRSNVGHTPTQAASGQPASSTRTCRNRNKSTRASNVRPRGTGRRAKTVGGPWAPVVTVPESEQLAYIRCCAHNEARKQSYWLWTWEAADPSRRLRTPYRCGSWRCPYGCRPFAGHLLFERIRESFDPLPPGDLVMLTLTLPSLDHARGLKSDAALAEVYRDVLERKEKFWRRLRRLHELRGWEWIGSSYVAVLEQHASGIPHVNLLVHSPGWAQHLRRGAPAEWQKDPKNYHKTHGNRHWLFDSDLQIHAAETGWGWRCTAEPVRANAVDQLAGYIVKLAGRTDAMHGEIAKACQLPLRAPRHFRRLRAGRGFLVPRRRKEGWTGTIVRRKWTEHGDEMVLPLVLSKNEEYMQRVRECCAKEFELVLLDEERRSNEVARRKLHSDRNLSALDEWLARFDGLAVAQAREVPEVSSHVFAPQPRARAP